MTTLTIKDLPDRKELDRKEMAAVYGGSFLSWLGSAWKTNSLKAQENQEQLQALETFGSALNKAGQI